MQQEDRTKRKILVVGGDSDALKTLGSALGRPSFRTSYAQNGLDALDQLEKETADVVIYDEDVLAGDGFSLLERLKQDFRMREIPLLCLTQSDQGDEMSGLRPGFDEVLAKPLEVYALLDALMNVIVRKERKQSLLRTDVLTGLLNREAVEHEIKYELSRLTRYGKVGSLILIDPDDFKVVNDRFGSTIGDLLLITLADTIRTSIRSSDVLGRFGTQEFLLFLPETRAESATELAQRLIQKFGDSEDMPVDSRLSFCAGIVEAPRDGGNDFDLLCRRADQAMTVAKSTGKARAVPWNEEMKTSYHGMLFLQHRSSEKK